MATGTNTHWLHYVGRLVPLCAFDPAPVEVGDLDRVFRIGEIDDRDAALLVCLLDPTPDSLDYRRSTPCRESG